MKRGEGWWDVWFLGLAKYVSTASKDPGTKTGAVIVDDKRRIVSVGYNGLPRNVEDSPDRLENRETKLKIIIHCERNALLFASKSVEGCTLYTWPFMACAACASMVIQAGIKRCVAPISTNERWEEEFQIAKKLFSEAGIILDLKKGELW